MNIITNFTLNKQMDGIINAISEGIHAPVLSYDSKDKLEPAKGEEIVRIGKLDTKELVGPGQCLYVVFVRVGKEVGVETLVDSDGLVLDPDLNMYLMDEQGLHDLFSDLANMFKIKKEPKEKLKDNVVENMMDYDVLLKDFYLAYNEEDDREYDIGKVDSNEKIAHKVKQINRYASNSYVVFDIACLEYMVLIIIDKKTAEVKEIKTIAASDKDSIKAFREWIEKDGISFFEYSKTLKEIF